MKAVYLSHGGGPLPLLGDPGHEAMVSFMKKLPEITGVPDAVLAISAHWEEEEPTLLTGKSPSLLYDYYGFPEESYKLKYPAPGATALSNKIVQLLQKDGFPCREDSSRGFDHGVFIPMMLSFPEANTPVTQISMMKSLDPVDHLKLGHALKSLQNENVLILASGFSFHNMMAYDWNNLTHPDPENDSFQEWLIETVVEKDPVKREERLVHWENAPGARYCHPREEHLLPLHVCAGISESPGRVIFDDSILGKRSVSFLWE